MASLESLEELLQEELKDIYDAEKQLTKALPKLAKKASAPELKQAFEEHLRHTTQHVERLEQVFNQLGMPAKGKKSEGMQNLIRQGEEIISVAVDADARDAIMIAATQKLEHYEIAVYGTARTWANLLGKRDVASLLEDTLEEEKEADQKLTNVAESVVNPAAAEAEAATEGRGRAMAAAGRTTTTARVARHTAAERASRTSGRTRSRARSR